MLKKKVTKPSPYTPISIFTYHTHLGLLCLHKTLLHTTLWVYWSKNGSTFAGVPEKITITLPNKKAENITKCHSFSISHIGPTYILTYIRKMGNSAHLVTATTKTFHHFKVVNEIPHMKEKAVVVPNYFGDEKYLMYIGGLFVGHAVLPAHEKKWDVKPQLLFTSRSYSFDHGPLTIMGSYITPRGILVIYDATFKEKNTYVVQAGAVLFDQHEPSKLIWRSDTPLWQELVDVTDETIDPLGATFFKDELFLYWTTSTKTVLKASIPAIFMNPEEAEKVPPLLTKFPQNPIILPHSTNDWECEAVFNPAAFYDQGKVHLIYRAIGSSGISVFGYSASDDGLGFDTRHPHPVFKPTVGFDIPAKGKAKGPQVYDHSIYGSGGGWAGCEDPRAVKIGKRIYMTYVAFSGWDSIRIALTSISLDDFRAEKWNWKKPIYLSPPRQTHKNWVLFPEKINGKFAIIHGIAPEILVDYIDDLDNVDKYIESKRLQGPQPGRRGFWDAKVRGVGPPPLKTKIGWLILYHATDPNDPSKYKLGAMILDLKDPRKVLHRTSRPILTPELYYENEGKPGIVYASGAIVKKGHLYVYYGGGDRVVCVATANLDEFLEGIVKDVNPPLNFKSIKFA